MDEWTAQLKQWPMLLTLIAGQTSNLLSVLVLARPKLRKNSCSLYLLGASVSNTVCLIFGSFTYVLSAGFGVLLQSQSRFLCKFIPYIYYSTLFLAAWFILLACIDRYCSTSQRAFIRRFSRANVAKLFIILLCFFTFIIHIHLLIYVELVAINRCTTLSYTYIVFLYVYYMVVYAFMTPLLYIFFTVLTIINVKRTKQTMAVVIQRGHQLVQPAKRPQTLNAQLLHMLLVQVISFIVLTMPFAALNVYAGISATWVKSPSRRSLEAFLSVIFRLLTYINSGSSCVIYALTARLFRQELQALFRCKWIQSIKRQSQIFSVSRRVAPA